MAAKDPDRKDRSGDKKPHRQGAKPKVGQGGNLKEATILIPLTYNDGTQVPQATIEAILEQMYVAFLGWTIEGTVKGAYRMQTGSKQVDKLMKVSVVLDAAQVPELETMIGGWCGQLGQEKMLLKIADMVIKFVPPQTQDEQP
jgi:hypothetical protein